MKRTLTAAVAVPLLLLSLPATAQSADGDASRASSVTITSPAAGEILPPGDITLRGRAGATATAEKHSVVYTVDLSGSVSYVDQLDCSGDGTVDDDDDLNDDGSIGDVLDCEIAAVNAINAGVAALPEAETEVRVGLLGFADSAVMAQMSPTAGELLIAPGRADVTGGNVAHVATTLEQGRVNNFAPYNVGEMTNYDEAVRDAVTALNGRSGNKWIFFVSDGVPSTSVSSDTFDLIRASGVRIRTFAVGTLIGADACAAGDLAEMAEVTGESCTYVADPTKLAANITGSTPANIESVTVSGVGSTLTANVDALGNWEATAPVVAAGDYTATATAAFSDGSTATAAVSFSVQAGPPPGQVERWDGRDRYEASAKISERSFSAPARTAFIASGEIFTDALSGSPVAGDTPGPVLLVKRDEIPPAIRAELTRLNPQRIVILGGPNTITTNVQRQLSGYSSSVLRWDGADRYAASASISANYFSSGVATAFVASGLVFPDALSGSPIAGDTPGPMLLVRTDTIPDPIKAELARLKPKEIVVLGGPASINDTIQRDLRAYTRGSVERWAGLDRYEASAQISARSFRPGVRVAYVASGQIYTDALSGSPVAGNTPGPMLLVKSTSIPPSIDTELRRLRPQKIVILGGPNSVSTDIQAELESYLS